MKIFYISICIILSTIIFAQDNTIRMGIIDHSIIQTNSNRGKIIFSQVNNYTKNINNKLSNMLDEIRQLDNQLISSSINDSSKKTISEQRNILEQKIQKFHDDSEIEILKLGDQAALQYTTEIFPIINELAKEYQLHLLLQYKAETMYPVDDKVVFKLTEEIIKLYNNRYA